MPSCAVPTCSGEDSRLVPFPQHSTLKIRWIRAIVAGTGLDLPARHLGRVCSWHFSDKSSGYAEPVRFQHQTGTIVTVSSCRFCQRFDDHAEMVSRDRLLKNEDLAFVVRDVLKVTFSDDDLLVDICKRCNARLNSLAQWINECGKKETEYRAFEVAAKGSTTRIKNDTRIGEIQPMVDVEIDTESTVDPLMVASDEAYEGEIIEEEIIMPEPMMLKVEEDEQEPVNEPIEITLQTSNHPAKRGRPKSDPPTEPPAQKLKFRDVLSRKCYICNTLLETHEDMAAHLTTDHTDRSTFHCTDCNQSFKVVTAFNRHLGFHDQEHRPLKCHFCPMGFKDAYSLQRHENRHHGTDHQIKKKQPPQERKFQCASCEKTFRTNYDLVDHDRFVHQKLPGATCKLCGKHFRNRASLRKHHLVHTGDKPYDCEHCEAAFKSTWHLINHVARFHGGPEGEKATGEDSQEEEEDTL
uniref:Zinc finger and SCAN domain-containing protein 2 n=1 Tax=Culex pipiens TaxID=7175 RepID=A0A8D8KAW0_CULPI